MSALSRICGWFYAQSLKLYPKEFRAAFADEMNAVFIQAIEDQDRPREILRIFLRELRDLPGSLFEAYGANWLRGGKITVTDEYMQPSTRWQALFGLLPFMLYGILSLISAGNLDFFLSSIHTFLGFYLFTLLGLLIGWIRGFPLWSYSYLGWSLVFAWWWSNMHIGGMYRIWIPFGITILVALIWTRSLTPIKNFFRANWHDWTRLMLAMFTLETWVLMIYDENHHPYLLAFILASALVASGGVWFFLRSSNLWGRILSLTGGFITEAILSGIAWTTWSWHEYYGFPKPEHWYEDWGISYIAVTFWLVILFWPALIALIRRILPHRARSDEA
jgi:hypothetical protein